MGDAPGSAGPAQMKRPELRRPHTNQKRPGKPGRSLHRSKPEEDLRGLLALDHRGVAVLGAIDRDRARLFRLGDLTHEIDVQETVFEARAFDLDKVGQLEHALEGTRRNALIEHLTAFLLLLGVFLAADGQRVLFRYDREFRPIEAGDRNGYAVRIFSGPLDVIGRITRSGALDALIEQREQP